MASTPSSTPSAATPSSSTSGRTCTRWRITGLAIAFTSARTARHADIGVATLEPWRGRGFATAAASLVAGAIQADGQTPVWSTGEGNLASLRVAAKIGFVEVGRRTYVIPAL